ncbi:hypothetical protein [Ralstonia phage RSF1]|uniref:Virion structural protein n=1 Tax=Ralstonia phage RSF1 TaxID=1689679 RepID=A0A0K2QRC6_9CAUD|nr:hypothetical protein AVU11_gp099 [Ralstonia phage RSF1]BAS04891.1 hypothetical protein [Ralstonia phage RSF1]
MEHVTRTLWFSALQSAMVRGAAYKWLRYTTLNEKFNVLPQQYPGAGAYTKLGYIALGRGGLGMSTGADGQTYPTILQHKSNDGALFNHMPFSLRLLDNDLPAERRSRYALRQQVEYNGTPYWAYWLKRVDFSQADTDLFLKQTLDDGSSTVTDVVPDESTLNPTPTDLTESGTNLLAGYSVLASTIISLPLDDFDISEIRAASQIITQRADRAIVSELALCTGADQVIQAQSQTGTFPFTEAVGVQIASFVQAMYPLDYINQSLADNLELGISEPLFQLEGVNA